ncbi:MAG: thiamine phosphate synthase [Cohaesibacter sp.]|jgi:thiamine-phosphate pyrophosphorylase|nr:thiamine phosphate synthase [Cohaesibacter sp.]
MRRLFDLSLYLVLDPDLCAPLGMVETTRQALAGGATAVQLRHKSASTEEFIAIGRELKSVLAGSDCALVINDNVEAAHALSADALHIGQEDMPVHKARALIGPDMILGLSVETPELARAVDPALVDYVGVGPVFATPTKPDHKPATGFDGLAQLVAAAPVPSVAIGGLKPEHVAQTLATGAQGLAIVSAICGQADPQAATQNFAKLIKEARS